MLRRAVQYTRGNQSEQLQIQFDSMKQTFIEHLLHANHHALCQDKGALRRGETKYIWERESTVRWDLLSMAVRKEAVQMWTRGLANNCRRHFTILLDIVFPWLIPLLWTTIHLSPQIYQPWYIGATQLRIALWLTIKHTIKLKHAVCIWINSPYLPIAYPKILICFQWLWRERVFFPLSQPFQSSFVDIYQLWSFQVKMSVV